MTLALAMLLLPQASAVLREAREHPQEGRWASALEAYRRVPDPPASGEGAPDAWASAYAARAEAQWGIALCLLRLDRPAEALEEFEKAGSRWSRARLSGCGHGQAQSAVEALVGHASALERLGRYAEALTRYFATLDAWPLYEDRRVAPRIVALYRIAGREPALREELIRRDAAHLRRNPPNPRTQPDLDLLQFSPTRPVRRVLELGLEGAGGQAGSAALEPVTGVPLPPLPRTLALP
ncbi:MAG TPA: tetratricopeptide repeat protein [Planctomycetota bacterium]|nr:tetratricopeptide repeat protein [Planctomycetota bacterium]